MAQNININNLSEDCIMVGQQNESPLSSCPSSPEPEASPRATRKALPEGRLRVHDGKIHISEDNSRIEKIAELALSKSPDNTAKPMRGIAPRGEPPAFVDRFFSSKVNNQENQEKFMKLINLVIPTFEPQDLIERVRPSPERTHYMCLTEGCTLPMATRGCAVRCFRKHNQTYRCLLPTCSRTFGTKYEVFIHIAGNHIEYFDSQGCLMEDRSCGYCNILFNKGTELKDHLTKNHSGVKHQTPAQLTLNLLSTFPQNRLEGYNIEEEKAQDVEMTGIKLLSQAQAHQVAEKSYGPHNKYTEGRPLPMRQSYTLPSAVMQKPREEGMMKLTIDMLDLDHDELRSVMAVLSAAKRQKSRRQQ